VTPNLVNVLTYRTGINRNDTTFKNVFPFVQTPWPGTHNCDCSNDDQSSFSKTAVPSSVNMRGMTKPASEMGVAAPEVFLSTSPNPAQGTNIIRYRVETPSQLRIVVFDQQGRMIKELVNKKHEPGVYTVQWDTKSLTAGSYIITALKDGNNKQSVQMIKD